jgi:hypothetical protein
MDSPLMIALKQFDATEANLLKAERLVAEAQELIPSGIRFGGEPQYDDKCRAIEEIAQHLPAIDAWKPKLQMMDLDDIAQWRLDEAELGEPSVGLYRAIEEPSRKLAEYHFKFNRKRRALIREALFELITIVDADLLGLREELHDRQLNEKAAEPAWDALRAHIAQIETLLGSSIKQPDGWGNLRRHLAFAMVCDFHDVQKADWPPIKKWLTASLYGDDEPLPVETEDLADLVALKPRGPVTAKLRWSSLTAEDFERLVFFLISSASGYENPTWLMHTNAPDRGRDLSVFRVSTDALSGTTRTRIIIQCRHRQSGSISPADVATLREQMKLWGEPRVDVLVIATSGRFTMDAVSLIEKHNMSDHALRIEMWPESHLERLLASHPALIAEFSLR